MCSLSGCCWAHRTKNRGCPPLSATKYSSTLMATSQGQLATSQQRTRQRHAVTAAPAVAIDSIAHPHAPGHIENLNPCAWRRYFRSAADDPLAIGHTHARTHACTSRSSTCFPVFPVPQTPHLACCVSWKITMLARRTCRALLRGRTESHVGRLTTPRFRLGLSNIIRIVTVSTQPRCELTEEF
jgi:hypothetical protein